LVSSIRASIRTLVLAGAVDLGAQRCESSLEIGLRLLGRAVDPADECLGLRSLLGRGGPGIRLGFALGLLELGRQLPGLGLGRVSLARELLVRDLSRVAPEDGRPNRIEPHVDGCRPALVDVRDGRNLAGGQRRPDLIHEVDADAEEVVHEAGTAPDPTADEGACGPAEQPDERAADDPDEGAEWSGVQARHVVTVSGLRPQRRRTSMSSSPSDSI